MVPPPTPPLTQRQFSQYVISTTSSPCTAWGTSLTLLPNCTCASHCGLHPAPRPGSRISSAHTKGPQFNGFLEPPDHPSRQLLPSSPRGPQHHFHLPRQRQHHEHPPPMPITPSLTSRLAPTSTNEMVTPTVLPQQGPEEKYLLPETKPYLPTKPNACSIKNSPNGGTTLRAPSAPSQILSLNC